MRGAAEIFHAVQRIKLGVQRLRRLALAASRRLARTVKRFFLLQMRGIHQHHASQLAARRGGNDFAAEAALDKQRQPSAMVKVSMGEQHEINGGGIKTEWLGIFFIQFAPALIQAAINQYPLACTFNHVAGTGNAAIRTVERKFH